jgi:hypothetical protein
VNAVLTAIAAVKLVILLLGGAITYIAFRAYRHTNSPSLRVLGVGFGIITFGAFLSGIANQFFAVSLAVGVLANSVFVAAGLAVIMYSLYIQQ